MKANKQRCSSPRLFRASAKLDTLNDDRLVIDVGLASVAGAEQILAGEDLYGAESYRHPELHPDTYGPVNYLLYVPFAWAIDSPQHAARAATNAFDLATLASVILLGWRLGGRRHGRSLGLLLGYAWATSPYAFFASIWAYNDMLVPLAVVIALIGVSAPWVRGASLGIGAAIKFVPALLWPLFLCAPGGTLRTRIAAGIGSVALAVALFALFIPDGGVRELYDRTVGWQLSRDSTISLWGQFGAITPFRSVAVALVAVLALLGGVVARRLSLFQLVAFAADRDRRLRALARALAALVHRLVRPALPHHGARGLPGKLSGHEEPGRPASDREAEQGRADPDDHPVSPGAIAEHG